ncbi:MAG: replication-relaxation family protein [Candidatus Limnocylindria bacterium]
MAGWSALPLRDQRLLEWLFMGDLVTAAMAAVLAYGHLRVAQRRLARLAEYGLLRGFWSANSQRPRGRYAYALTKAARLGLEQLIWDGKLEAPRRVEAPSPVIHQLATHDLLLAIMRAPSTRDGYLAGWAPERAIALAFSGYLRPDALAVMGVGDRAVELFIERDLGTERGAILASKARTYSSLLSGHEVPMNVGFVVESARRAAALAYRLRHWLTEYELPGHGKAPCWVTVADELAADPFGVIWRAPDGRRVSARDMASFQPAREMPPLGPLCLLSEHGPEAMDDRLLTAVGDLGRNVWP